MQLKYGYQRVAKRSLLACEEIIKDGLIKLVIHEKAAFLAYHAFELRDSQKIIDPLFTLEITGIAHSYSSDFLK
ncbi:MAG: hypothetical protein LH649_11445 [Pseudanabaena sp. CAN_BIN31]|nr:hypothetical protein [Pseudanabaena sp. CAN_BIN31]